MYDPARLLALFVMWEIVDKEEDEECVQGETRPLKSKTDT